MNERVRLMLKQAKDYACVDGRGGKRAKNK